VKPPGVSQTSAPGGARSGIRQNRRQVTELLTSRHKLVQQRIDPGKLLGRPQHLRRLVVSSDTAAGHRPGREPSGSSTFVDRFAES